MKNELKEKILKIIEKNNKLTDEEVAVMLGVDTEVVAVAVKELEADKIICGYHTLINWDKTGDDEVSASTISILMYTTHHHFYLQRVINIEKSSNSKAVLFISIRLLSRGFAKNPEI
ncbi:MAG: Lrp/AsnC family transcriptional regulator [Trichococcus flocculiformis]